MPKSFEYKEAKEQIHYYKKLLANLDKGSIFYLDCKNKLKSQIEILHRNNFFSELVEQGINGNSLNFDDNNLNMFLANIYYFKEGSKFSDICSHLISTYGSIVRQHIANLSSGSNAIFWLFSSKKKKISIEDSYNELVKMRDSLFCTSANEVINQINCLKNTNTEIIEKDYLSNISIYKQSLIKAIPTVFSEHGNANIFKPYENEYKTIKMQTDEIKNSIQYSVKEIKDSVDRLLAEELVISLRAIPVDELNRDKSGIKTKFLKDAGYENLADVFCASVMQIASIYGISQDKAYTIKSKCDKYAKNLHRELKIKLSIDNKSKAATKVVYSIFSYLQKMDCSLKIDELNEQHESTIKKGLEMFNDVGNGVKWPFMSESEINNARLIFDKVRNTLTNQYKPKAREIYDEFKAIKSDSNNAWNDFAANSIKYFNVIEEVYPGVLGNDDSIYGLPEELAKEIQDECFFPDGLLCTLRKYQEWGVKYILHQEKVLLGDEMGLGKTIQAIATMVSLKNTGATHFLVICPASVVINWCREITKHSRLRVTKIHGSRKEESLKSWIKTGGVAVTNFESTSHIKLDVYYRFSMLVVDEAHFIKNVGARRSINTRELAKHADRLLFMTGTALENNVDEMISLIDALRPSIAEQVKGLAFMASAPQFREKIAPVYYRRKREDVLTELPDKIESKEWCTLNAEEERIYEDTVLNKKYPDPRRVSWNIDDLNKSCKAQRLKEIVDDAEAEGRKVLVFSFFLETIAKIHEFLKGKCLNPINGSVNVNRRQEIIDEFDKAPAGTVLLAQITSGGTGLNIQSASVVVICEPQFKPSIENQAISRVYRMGQSRNVLVYRLLCVGTIDEKLIDVLEQKQKLFDAFADKSVAAQQSLEIDDKTFGNIINEEIERINKKRGIPSEASLDVKQEIERPSITNLKEFSYNPITTSDTGIEYYKKIMKMSYHELVQFLINKYGPSKYDYFTNEYCTIKNKKVTRTSEGLFCHHIDEDKAILLSNSEYASQNPFEYQKANRLVYCNFLEHLLLHILIFEEPKNIHANRDEIQGICGAIFYLCAQLNDIYSGYHLKEEWRKNVASVVINDYESYILILRRLWKDIQENKYSFFRIPKEELAKGWDGTLYTKILNDL